MTPFSASEVQLQNRSILRPKRSQITTDKQKLLVRTSGDTLAGILGGWALDIINVTNVTVDTPFLIWAQPSNMLVASHIQPQNSTAQINYIVDSNTLSDDIESVTLSFYFQWENSNSNPVLLSNVLSRLVVDGRWDQSAASSLIDPYHNHTVLNADVRLSILEWWNQPPTSPPLDGRQIREVLYVWLDGGLHVTDGAGRNATTWVSNSFDVKFPHSIRVPPKGVIVFKVDLSTMIDMMGDYDTAHIRIFGSNSFVACPFVNFQVTEDVVTKGPPLP